MNNKNSIQDIIYKNVLKQNDTGKLTRHNFEEFAKIKKEIIEKNHKQYERLFKEKYRGFLYLKTYIGDGAYPIVVVGETENKYEFVFLTFVKITPKHMAGVLQDFKKKYCVPKAGIKILYEEDESEIDRIICDMYKREITKYENNIIEIEHILSSSWRNLPVKKKANYEKRKRLFENKIKDAEIKLLKV